LERFGNKTFDDLVVDELMINAYEYNSNQPRFYSKYFRNVNKGTHDVILRKAMGGSSAAPMMFDP
jgi:patatin-like phospholipase/acyl hydrolase